jgi:hypothetical protein
MKKESTRPLLVGIVERWRALEQAAFRALQALSPGPGEAQRQAMAEHQTAHRELTQAETLLWLADQQWQREERLACNLVSLTGGSVTEALAPTPSKPDAEK